MNYRNGRKAAKQDRVFIYGPNGLKVGTVKTVAPKTGLLTVESEHQETEIHPALCNTVDDHNAGHIDPPAAKPKPTEKDLELESPEQ